MREDPDQLAAVEAIKKTWKARPDGPLVLRRVGYARRGRIRAIFKVAMPASNRPCSCRQRARRAARRDVSERMSDTVKIDCLSRSSPRGGRQALVELPKAASTS